MPVIAKFYGIIIKMYFINSEHNPPHIHAYYNSCSAVIKISDLLIMDGELPPKALEMVIEWVSLHQTELLNMWKTQKFSKIKGLE